MESASASPMASWKPSLAPCLIEHRQLVVVREVVVVTELVVDGDEILLGGLDAHLDAQIVVERHVPRAGVADDLAIVRLAELRALPERLRQRIEAQRGEEGLAESSPSSWRRTSAPEGRRHVQAGLARVRLHQRVDVAPLLRPHVAEQVRRDGLARGHLVRAVLLRQLRRARSSAGRRRAASPAATAARSPSRSRRASCRSRSARDRRCWRSRSPSRPRCPSVDEALVVRAHAAEMACQPFHASSSSS